MKIKIEIDEQLNEDEITIRCRELNDQIEQLQKAVREINASSQRYVFQKGESQYYLSLDEILFFEADDHHIYAHTKNEVYETKYKLYELEKLLPSYFLRVSKSTVLNMREVLSIKKNLTSASLIEFRNSDKRTYVSRSYYKMLEMRMRELYLRGFG
ncbi:MAG: LytTR family transcriptional regulator [Lachnospiraceae bacterium]|nr:LytTR family transcriptional regulator [Lachnospiraceae bacterium]